MLGSGRSYPVAGRGILAVGYHDIYGLELLEAGEHRAQEVATLRADNVAYKKYIHYDFPFKKSHRV